jgi:putative oxidoreductase
LRRLFWTFVPGVPGAALLVMRVVTAAALTANGISHLSTPVATGSTTLLILQTAAGFLLLVGFWTPVVGLLVLVLQGWQLFSQPQDYWTHILLGTLAGALALLGPGAWSVDAWLFGWKRINIRDRQTRPETSVEGEP